MYQTFAYSLRHWLCTAYRYPQWFPINMARYLLASHFIITHELTQCSLTCGLYVAKRLSWSTNQQSMLQCQATQTFQPVKLESIDLADEQSIDGSSRPPNQHKVIHQAIKRSNKHLQIQSNLQGVDQTISKLHHQIFSRKTCISCWVWCEILLLKIWCWVQNPDPKLCAKILDSLPMLNQIDPELTLDEPILRSRIGSRFFFSHLMIFQIRETWSWF